MLILKQWCTRNLPVATAVLVAAAWRLWLMDRYAGWEESDYGNLAMIQGVVEGGFRHFDMNHMPGYYGISAFVHLLVNDAVIAGRSVSFLGGLVALGLATRIAIRMGGARCGWLVGLLLVVQPEFALYSASTLREPLAAAFVLGCVSLLLSERMVWAGVLAGCAFLVRFDLALVLAPVVALHAFGRPNCTRRILQGLVPLVVAVVVWSVYCRIDHGTFVFWSHSVSVNLETGLGAEAEAPGQWWFNGLSVVGGLLGWLLPWRVGWGLWLGLLVGLWFFLRGMLRLASGGEPDWKTEFRRLHGVRRTVTWTCLLMLGLWAGIGFVGQHSPSHNLYWKWLCPIIPILVPVAVVGLLEMMDRTARVVGSFAARAVIVVFVVQAVWSNLHETERQRLLSESWYRPQLKLAQYIEAEIGPSVPMILDNIPACWIRRTTTQRPMTSWFDVPVKPGDRVGFSKWIEDEQIEWVLWFREDWTQAPRIAPFLANGGTWEMGSVRLVEREREDGYGWIWFEVLNTLDVE
jgi:hypothetical protein